MVFVIFFWATSLLLERLLMVTSFVTFNLDYQRCIIILPTRYKIISNSAGSQYTYTTTLDQNDRSNEIVQSKLDLSCGVIELLFNRCRC